VQRLLVAEVELDEPAQVRDRVEVDLRASHPDLGPLAAPSPCAARRGALRWRVPDLEQTLRFVRERTSPAPVPLVPELTLHQATELTPLWRATASELHAWDDSPYWAFPWAGGQSLARHVLDHPRLVRGLHVLDFASGSGLVAIAAARAGAASVLAVDVDPFCRAAVLANAALNGVEIPFRDGDPIGEPLAGVDVVLAGDVFYERALAARALAWFRALAARGVRVLAGDAGRVYAPGDGVRELAIHLVPTTVEIEDAPLRAARVLEILPSPATP
jgi:predicted nicotinamide N-methyase